MMKKLLVLKLLVLMMVFGMASIASAAVQISVNGQLDVEEISINMSDTITIGIWNTGVDVPEDFLAYLDFGMVSEGGFSLSGHRLNFWDPDTNPTGGAGNFPASWSQYPAGDYTEIEVAQAWAVGSPEVAPGTIFLVDMHCELEGVTVTVNLFDSRVGYTEPLETLIVHQGIPEPMTLALLGIGGLFLKRRK